MAITISNLSTREITPMRVAQPQTPAPKTSTGAQDAITLSGKQAAAPLTYTEPREGKTSVQTEALPPDLQAMLAESSKQVDEIMAYLMPLLEKQGLDLAKLASGEQKLTADPAAIEAAKAAISEDGEFGVRKTAERILSFAKFATQGDDGQLDTIRAAVQKGFDEAQRIFGGTLPDISQQTYKAVMGELDRWAKEGIPTGETVSLAKPAAAQAAA
jgi:hypothetical protein